MSAPSFWWEESGLTEELSSDDLADERRVLQTTFPERLRPHRQSLLGDLFIKELRAAVEGVFRWVLPFFRDDGGNDDAEDMWFSAEPADPLPIELSTEPDDEPD